MEVYLFLGEFYMAKGEHKEALNNFNQAHLINATNEGAILGILKINFAMKKHEKNIEMGLRMDYSIVKNPWIFVFIAKSNYHVVEQSSVPVLETEEEDKHQKTVMYLNLAYKLSKKKFEVIVKIIQLLFRIRMFNYVS